MMKAGGPAQDVGRQCFPVGATAVGAIAVGGP